MVYGPGGKGIIECWLGFLLFHDDLIRFGSELKPNPKLHRRIVRRHQIEKLNKSTFYFGLGRFGARFFIGENAQRERVC